MSEVAVLSAADGGMWEARLLAELAASAGTARIVRRCVDVVELLAVAAAGQGQAALVSARLRRLDADAIERLEASGVAVVAVLDAEESTHEAALRLQGLGVKHVVGADAAADVVAAVIDTAVAALTSRKSGVEPSRSFALPTSAVAPLADRAGWTGSAAQQPAGPSDAGRRGAVIAVWGPSGGAGRTTIAINLAAELAGLGADTMLIDADVYGGLVAPMLGLLDESPGVAAAARHAAGGRLDLAALASLCWQVEPSLRVLTGLPRADRWPELRPAAVPALLAAARQIAEFVVVDLSFCLETDEELSFDTLAPRRNGATLAVLDDADLVLAVGQGDTAGVHRLVRAMSELREAQVATPVWIALNKVRASAAYGRAGAQLTQSLQRFVGQAPAAMLPLDVTGCDVAALAGQPLASAAPRSPLRLEILELAGALCGRAAPRGGRPAGRRRAGRGQHAASGSADR